MSNFTITRLMGERAQVSGTDVAGNSGRTVVSTAQWDELNANTAFDKAKEAFDEAVENFFKPLTDAAEKLETAMSRPEDSIGYVVLHEGVSGTQAQDEVIVKLTRDSIVLRLIEEGDTDRLLWVGDDLEITAAAAPATDVVVEDGDVTPEG